jgi:hypothetical protein
VFFEENGEEWVLDNEQEVACNLEWFDSDDPDEHVLVTDGQGRAVRLKVQALKVVFCELLKKADSTTVNRGES